MAIKLGISFGASVMQSGQRNVGVDIKPQLEVKSTLGQFSITAPVSRALGLAVGQNIMFACDRDQIAEAIINQNPDVINAANANGFDLTDAAQVEAFLDECETWFIAKGYQKLDSAGNPLMASLRMTKEEKAAYFKSEYDAADDDTKEGIVEQMRELMDAPEATIDDIVTAIATDENVSKYIKKQTEAFEGSKTAANSNAVGIGVALTFSDTNIWNQLKKNIDAADRDKSKRIFDVDVTAPVKTEFNNGYENVEVLLYPLTFVEDTKPAVIGGKKD